MHQFQRCVLGFALAVAQPTLAAGDLTRQDPVVVEMRVGNEKNEHRFMPDLINLETGKLYVLRLSNPSTNDYYFNPDDFVDTIFTRKVAVAGKDGKVMIEVYGAIRRVELKAGGSLEWWLVPLRTGVFRNVHSTKAHTDAGMRATIEVK